jgi:Paraquat-inducible protein A
LSIYDANLMLCNCEYSLYSPHVAFLPPYFYSIDLSVVPKWGLYANLTAQIISQISSHIIIHFHRRIVEVSSKLNQNIPELVNTDTALLDDEGSEVENVREYPVKLNFASVTLEFSNDRLCDHAFRRPHRGELDKLVPRRMVGPGLVFLTISCTVLVVFGCILPSYSVRALGIVGILVESGQKFASADTKFSVLTTIQLLFNQAKLTGTAADFVGLGSLSIIMLFSVLIAPIVQSSVLLIQWFVPLTRKRRYRIMMFLEILQAWQYAEVYLLAIIVGSWQLGPISGQFLEQSIKFFLWPLLTFHSDHSRRVHDQSLL